MSDSYNVALTADPITNYVVDVNAIDTNTLNSELVFSDPENSQPLVSHKSMYQARVSKLHLMRRPGIPRERLMYPR